jgi:hypothetical protein
MDSPGEQVKITGWKKASAVVKLVQASQVITLFRRNNI